MYILRTNFGYLFFINIAGEQPSIQSEIYWADNRINKTSVRTQKYKTIMKQSCELANILVTVQNDKTTLEIIVCWI